MNKKDLEKMAMKQEELLDTEKFHYKILEAVHNILHQIHDHHSEQLKTWYSSQIFNSTRHF